MQQVQNFEKKIVYILTLRAKGQEQSSREVTQSGINNNARTLYRFIDLGYALTLRLPWLRQVPA